MSVRNAIRYLGLMLILAVYIASGIQKVVNPKIGAVLLAKSNFPYFLSLAGLHLTPEQYQQLIQATGIIFISFSLFILLGVGRSVFAFLLAIGTVIITVTFFVNIKNPLETSEDDQIKIMSNMAIIGGLLFVSGSGQRSRQYSEARAKVVEARSSFSQNQEAGHSQRRKS